jgi:hypothetical protein
MQAPTQKQKPQALTRRSSPQSTELTLALAVGQMWATTILATVMLVQELTKKD